MEILFISGLATASVKGASSAWHTGWRWIHKTATSGSENREQYRLVKSVYDSIFRRTIQMRNLICAV